MKHFLSALAILTATCLLAVDGNDDFGFPLDDEPANPAAKADDGDGVPAKKEEDDFFPLDDEEDALPPQPVDFQKVLQSVLQDALQDVRLNVDVNVDGADEDGFLDEFQDEDGAADGAADDFFPLDDEDDAGEPEGQAQQQDAQVDAVLQGLNLIITEALKQEDGGEVEIKLDGEVDVALQGALNEIKVQINQGQARVVDGDFAVDAGLDDEPDHVERPVAERYAEAVAAVFSEVKIEAENGLWYVDAEGVLRLIERETAKNRKVPAPGTLFAIDDLQITHLLPLDTELWAGTNHGVFLFKFSNWSWTRIAVNLLETDVSVNKLTRTGDTVAVAYGEPEELGHFDLAKRRWLPREETAPEQASASEPGSETAAAQPAAAVPPPAAAVPEVKSLPLAFLLALGVGVLVLAGIASFLVSRRNEV